MNRSALLLINARLTIVKTSDLAEEILESNGSSVINKPFDYFVYQEDRELFYKMLRSSDYNKDNTCSLKIQTGKKNTVPVYMTLLSVENNSQEQLFCISITKLENNSDNTGSSDESEYRNTFENIPIGTYKTTSGGKILLANPALINMLGYDSFKELAERNLEEEGYENQSFTRENFKKMLDAAGEIKGFESVWRRKDGRLIYVRENAKIISRESGEIIYEGTVEDITEKKSAEIKLLESEKRFRALIQNSSDVILLLGADGTVNFASPSLTRIGGYLPEEVIGKRIYQWIHPDDLKAAKEFFKGLIKTYNKPFTTELRARHKNGAWLWKEATASNFLNDSNVNAVIVNFRNITERKLVEFSLQKSKEEFRELANALPQIVCVTNETGTLLYYNQKWTDYTGLADIKTLNRVYLQLIHPDDKKRALELWNRTKRASGMFRAVFRFLRYDGQYRWHLGIGIKRNLEGEKSVRWLLTLTDIDEQKTAQEKLENALFKLYESERKLLDAQRIAHVGSYILDLPTGKFIWTKEIYNIFELNSSNEPPDMYEFANYIHPEDREEYLNTVRTAFSTFSNFEIEVRIINKNEKLKYIHYICRPAEDDSGQLTRRAGAIMDITERKLAQRGLERALEDLERSNRELEKFAYIASHDLQEPLRMITSYMKILEKDYTGQLDDKGREYMRYAVDGAKRMSNLIRDLLTYSRVTTQPGQFETVDMKNTLNDVITDLQLLITETNTVINSRELPVIKGDPVQLRQLFQNLISNAIKFRGENAPEITISVTKDTKGWVFSVKDNGIGIDPQHYERVFQLFQRLHNQEKYPGTGIGLAVCKKIVERHGGNMWVESELGAGTTFLFFIPLSSEIL